MNDVIKQLETLEKYGRDNHIPIILGPSAVRLVEVVSELNPREVLEIGTAIGYSSLLILKSTECRLTTIELNEDRYRQSQDNFVKYGVSDRVEGFNMDAMDYLKNNTKKFDFVFLDGPKGQYVKYLPHIKKSLNKGGVLLCDNVLFRGFVRSEEPIPHKYRTIVVNLRRFLDAIDADSDFESTIEDVGDGLLIAKRLQ